PLLGVAELAVEDEERGRQFFVELRRRAHVLEAVVGDLAMPAGAVHRLDGAPVDAFALRRLDAEGLAGQIEVELELAAVRRAEEDQRFPQIAVRTEAVPVPDEIA